MFKPILNNNTELRNDCFLDGSNFIKDQSNQAKKSPQYYEKYHLQHNHLYFCTSITLLSLTLINIWMQYVLCAFIDFFIKIPAHNLIIDLLLSLLY
jgi:hypothetical protein